MATEQIIRDILEVNSRLFDHRPILQGHIRAFVKEFEEKRGDREVTRLNNVKVLLTDLKDRIIPETKSDLDTSLTNIEAKVRVALEVCKKIEEKENNVEVGFLDLQRGRRKEEWDLFMQQQFEKSAKVDEEMDTEMKKLSAEYVELEKNLEKIPITAQ